MTAATATPAAIDRLIFQQVVRAGYSPLVAANVAAQARLETADYTSNVFRQNNNLFGYKYVNQRGATQGTPVPGNERSTGPKFYAKYQTLAASVDELLAWIRRRIDGKQFTARELETPDGYAAGFGRAPFRFYGVSVSQYAAGLKSKLRLLSNASSVPDVQTAGLEGWSMLLLAVVAFFMLRGQPAVKPAK